MIRFPISHKVFFTFATVTIFSCLLSAVLYGGLRGIQKINGTLHTVRDFHLSIQDMEKYHASLAGPATPRKPTEFTGEFSRARSLVAELLASPFAGKALLPARLATISNYLDNYRKASEELLEKNLNDHGLPEKNAALLDSLRPQIQSLRPEEQLQLYMSFQRLSFLQIHIYHSRDYAGIGELKEIEAAISTLAVNDTIRQTIGQFVRNLEGNYFNYLGLLDRKKFLEDTANLFFSYADDTAEELTRSVQARHRQLVWLITVITFSAILFTLVLWRLTSRYFHRFLQNQQRAITAIKAAEFDYRLPETLPDDELGDLTIFMKNLAGELNNYIQTITESEKEYRKLLQNISDWVWEADTSGTITFSSPVASQFTGTSQSEIVGRSIFNILPHPTLQKKVAAQLPLARLEVELRHKDGHTVVLETNGSPLFDEKGAHTGYQGISRDITYRKTLEKERGKLQEQLLQAQKMEGLGRLSGGIAHDFNNILTSILGYCDLALLDLEEGTPLRNKIEVIRESGERAAALTRQLLAFSRKQTLKMEALDLNALLSATVTMLRRMIGEDVELLVQPEPHLPNILADPVQIEQIIMNLVINARDAMPHGGRLTIATATIDLDEKAARFLEGLAAGLHVALSVTDTGEGIPKEMQEKIFEPFFTTKEKGKGTGLGLATTYGIVKQHRGHISVHSEPGRRTSFIIYLPATSSAPEEKKEAADSREMPRGSETLLIVDDEPLVLDLVSDTMKSLGYTVLKAENGAAAMEIFSSNPGIKLLLTDIVMPGMNGKELADKLLERKPELKVAFMSGYTHDILEEKTLRSGALFINKPLSTAHLAKALRQLLDGNPA